MQIHTRLASLIALLLSAVAVLAYSNSAALDGKQDDELLIVERVIGGLNDPWDFTFLCDGDVLITEKPGTIKRLNSKTGALTAIDGIPQVYYGGQGGLLGIALVRPCNDKHKEHGGASVDIFFAYSVEISSGKRTTRLMSASLSGKSLSKQKVVFTAKPALGGRGHFGGAVVSDGTYVFMSMGDRQQRKYAQELGSHLGAILRLNVDGSVPKDNPFADKRGALPEIWSWGHRNPQGLAFNPADNSLWSAEHGPRGGDEINRIEPGLNYGWPIITYGREYSGGAIGQERAPGLEQPKHWYVPSIATSGLDFYQGTLIEQWQGDLFVGALKGAHVNHLVPNRDGSFQEHRMLSGNGERIRAVHPGPDGWLYVLSSNGNLKRVKPASI